MRLAFAGTPEFAVPALRAVVAAGHDAALVLTRPDKPAGRGLKMASSAVKVAANDLGLRVFQPSSLRTTESQTELRRLGLDLLLVVAYGLILPLEILQLPRFGCVNIHASLLPRWRGAAPIQRAILAGDDATGVSIMLMDEGLDTGAVLHQAVLPIEPDDTTTSLTSKLAELGAREIVSVLEAIRAGQIAAHVQQESGVLYAAKIDKSEARIDWRQSATQIARQVRAFDPSPGAVAEWAGTTIKIWRVAVAQGKGEPGYVVERSAEDFSVACGNGLIRVLEVQRAGGRRVSCAEFLRGVALSAGESFVCPIS